MPATSSTTGGRLEGKVAIITGPARGQGAAEAQRFASEGAPVIAGDVLDLVRRPAAEQVLRDRESRRFPIPAGPAIPADHGCPR